jgi:hypothetical protein
LIVGIGSRGTLGQICQAIVQKVALRRLVVFVGVKRCANGHEQAKLI